MGLFSGIGNAVSGALGGIAGAVGGVASTILGNNSAKHEAEKNRQWQEQMSNTSISRRMQDLRNSGLNPLLAVENASSGASTPAGSQAQLQQFNPEWLVALSNAKLQNAQAEKVEEEKEGIEKENNMADTKHDLLKKEVELKSQNILTEKINQQVLRAETEKKAVEILLNRAHIKNVNMSTAEAYEIVRWQRYKNDIKFDLYNKYPELKEGLGVIDDFKGMSTTDAMAVINYMIRGNTGRSYKEFSDDVRNFIDKLNIDKKYIPREIKENRISR